MMVLCHVHVPERSTSTARRESNTFCTEMSGGDGAWRIVTVIVTTRVVDQGQEVVSGNKSVTWT